MISPVPPPVYDHVSPVSKRRRVVRFVVVLVVVAIAGTAALSWLDRRAGNPAASGVPSVFAAQNDTLSRAPTGTRVRVRVVNTTRTDGLAKRATAVLREHGFDVVDYEGDAKKSRDSTLVVTHTGHPDWSARVVRALGVGTVDTRPDTSRYVDLTVFIGRDWKAPTQPFRP